MNTTIELSMSIVMRIHELNRKFVSEIDFDEYSFPEFQRCYYCLLNRKWREYAEKN